MQIGLYSLDQAEQALEAFAAWQNDGGNDPKGNVIFSINLDLVVVGLTYDEPLDEPPSVFSPFFELTPMQMLVPPSNNTFSLVYEIGDSILPKEHLRYGVLCLSSNLLLSPTSWSY